MHTIHSRTIILKVALSLIFAVAGLVTVLNVSAQSIPVSCLPDSFHFGKNLVLACDSNGQLFKASDFGWHKVASPLSVPQVKESLDSILYLYSDNPTDELWRSADSGQTWEFVGKPSPFLFDVFPSPVSSTLFLGVRNIPAAQAPSIDPWQGILKSTNGGITWTAVLTNGSGEYVGISPNFVADGTAFASLGIYHGTLGIWKTTDGGETWSPVNNGLDLYGCLETYFWVMVSPQYAQDQTAFTSNCTGLFKTTNGGQSWVKINDIVPYEPPTLSPNYLTDQIMVADDRWGGLWLSYDGGQTFTRIWRDGIFASGIRYQLPFETSVVTSTPPLSAAYQIYLPVVYGTPDLEFWIVAVQGPQFDSKCYLYRSRDYGATWEAIAVFEASHWTYLPNVYH
jgi:photosystem II stability/assembly factor-like uncharacterized protein